MVLPFPPGVTTPNTPTSDCCNRHRLPTDVQDTIEDVAHALSEWEAGISELLSLMEVDRVGTCQYHARAMRGLLGPMARDMERHTEALANITAPSTTN